MGAFISAFRKKPSAKKVEVKSKKEQSKPGSEQGSHDRLLEGTIKQFQLNLGSSREHGLRMHNAIEMKDLDNLRFLVEDRHASLEETNDQGMTPLYNAASSFWIDGALFLLQHGADVRNADQTLSNRSCCFLSLVHVVLHSDNIKLLQEVINKGVAIDIGDLAENKSFDCQSMHNTPLIREFLYQHVMVKKPKEEHSQDPLIVLFDMINSGFLFEESTSRTQKIIQWKHSVEVEDSVLVLGAWLALKGNHHQALNCWEKSMDRLELWRQDSMFADILHIQQERLRHATRGNDIEILTQALFILERFSPTEMKLTLATGQVASGLLEKGEITTAIAVLRRLTDFRVLHTDESLMLLRGLNKILLSCSTQSNVPFSALLDSMGILTNCLGFLTRDGSFSEDNSSSKRHDVSDEGHCCNACRAMTLLRESALETLSMYFAYRIPDEGDQILHLYHHVRGFVSTFPWIRGQNLLHCLFHTWSPVQCLVSVIKILVFCSAEAKGTRRLVNSPPHLASDKNGDTPLHLFARHLSFGDLYQEEVLQYCLERGAHLCARNNQGQSVRDILLERNMLEDRREVIPLTCLAATAFRKDPRLSIDRVEPVPIKHILFDH